MGMDEFAESSSSLVADVDCTAGGQSLCEKHGVRGYPSIKWGDAGNMQDYDGGRDFDALKKFADENLGPTCGLDNLDMCDEDQKKLLKKYQKWDVDELDIAIEEADEKLKKLEGAAKKITDGLQNKIQAAQNKIQSENKKKKEKVEKETKASGLNWMRAVHKSRQPAEPAVDPTTMQTWTTRRKRNCRRLRWYNNPDARVASACIPMVHLPTQVRGHLQPELPS